MLHGRKLYAAVMLVDDVTGDCHTETCTVTYWLGCEEVVVEFCLHLIVHSIAVVGNGDRQFFALCFRTNVNSGLVVFTFSLASFPNGVEGIIDNVENRTADVLRNHDYWRQAFRILLVDGCIEAVVVGTHGMVTQPDVLMHQCVDVCRNAFAFLSA